MNIKTRKCLTVLVATGAIALYATAAYRVEMSRSVPQVASCTFGHCVPTSMTFSALR